MHSHRWSYWPHQSTASLVWECTNEVIRQHWWTWQYLHFCFALSISMLTESGPRHRNSNESMAMEMDTLSSLLFYSSVLSLYFFFSISLNLVSPPFTHSLCACECVGMVVMVRECGKLVQFVRWTISIYCCCALYNLNCCSLSLATNQNESRIKPQFTRKTKMKKK